MKTVTNRIWFAMVLVALLLGMAACRHGGSINPQGSTTDSASVDVHPHEDFIN